MNKATYLVAGSKPWNARIFEELRDTLPGTWFFISQKEELNEELLGKLKPRYVFFLHWSWLIPAQIVRDYECVCFHMTDVPYGRGGSPLQNLILRGHKETQLTALRMTESLDAGPVYLKRELSLSGSAQEILIRATRLSFEMISFILSESPTPLPQEGEPTLFKRRKPAESQIPDCASIEQLHDFIRMLDAESYPAAFLVHQGFRYEFTNAALSDGRITSTVLITPEAPSSASHE